MMHLVQSNKMEVLLANLLALLAKDGDMLQNSANELELELDEFDIDIGQVFQKQTILVQSPGMAQWLKLHIANHCDIAANIDFPLPSSFIWQLYKHHLPDLPDESSFTKDNLTWKIFSLLPELLDREEFKVIKQYLFDEAEGVEQHKCFQLSEKVADIYDQYLVYRPDWIEQWEKDGTDEVLGANVSSQAWQPILWRYIVKLTSDLHESRYHRANMHTELLRLLEGSQKQQTPVYIFGISSIPIQQLEVFSKLSESREVYIFWFNASAHYWSDVTDNKQYQRIKLTSLQQRDNEHLQSLLELSDVGNPLLASWGKIGREFQQLIQGFEFQQHDCFVEQESSSLLGNIQNDIYDLSFRGSRAPLAPDELIGNGKIFPKRLIQPSDDSLTVHSCYSKVRELERLKDQVLRWLDSGEIESLDDIIIMMPDVASYAPLIEAVFSDSNERKTAAVIESDKPNSISTNVPIAISDRSLVEENPIIQSFFSLLSISENRLTVNDVFSLLEVPEIFQRFGLEEYQVSLLKQWTTSANIRWGLSGEDKVRFDLPLEPQNTWQFGFRRMLAGYCHANNTLSLNDTEIAPLTDIEGVDTHCLGALHAFIEDINQVVLWSSSSQTLEEKINGALQLIDGFYLTDETNSHTLVKLRDNLLDMLKHNRQSVTVIEHRVFVSALMQRLSVKGVGQSFLAGRLNFCTLMPMRSIPFKAVCLLGMNQSDYPRHVDKYGFDLMAVAKARLGDRSRRLDDRYLFLEALLSAREKFYISYIGRSDQDNSERMSSVLVSELLEYCQLGYCLEGDLDKGHIQAEENLIAHLMNEYSLHPFDIDNFSRSFSYNSTWFSAASKLGLSGQKGNELIWRQSDKTYSELSLLKENNSDLKLGELEASDVLQFLRNTSKAYFRHSLQTQFPQLKGVEDENEPLVANNLNRYWHMNHIANVGNVDAELVHLKATGEFPVGTVNISYQNDLIASTHGLWQKLSAYLQTNISATEISNLKFSVSMEETVVHCRVQYFAKPNDKGHNTVLMHRPGKLRPIDRLNLWLIMCLAELSPLPIVAGVFVASDKMFTLPAIDNDIARNYVKDLLKLYRYGKENPLPFFPETSFEWVNSLDMDKTKACFEGNNFKIGEQQDKHNDRIYPLLDADWQAFDKISHWVYGPVVELGEVK